MATKIKAPPLSRKQKEKINEILTPNGTRGLAASHIMSKMGNLRGKSNIGQIRRYLDKNAFKRAVKDARGASLYTKKPGWVQDRLL